MITKVYTVILFANPGPQICEVHKQGGGYLQSNWSKKYCSINSLRLFAKHKSS
jgi:hypothetical protein